MSKVNVKCFQIILDDITVGKMSIQLIAIYGTLLILGYLFSYFAENPGTKLSQSLYLEFKLMALKKISTIKYNSYQKIGTGKILQIIKMDQIQGKPFYLIFISELLGKYFLI